MSDEKSKIILERITALETKLDMFLAKTNDMEKRIRFLEKSVWIAIGVFFLLDKIIGKL